MNKMQGNRMIKNQMTGRKSIGEFYPIFVRGYKKIINPQTCIPLPQILRTGAVQAEYLQLTTWGQGYQHLRSRLQQQLQTASNQLQMQKKLAKGLFIIYFIFILSYLIASLATFLCIEDQGSCIIAIMVQTAVLAITAISTTIIFIRRLRKQITDALYEITMKNDGYQVCLKSSCFGQNLNRVEVYEIQ